MQKKQIPKDVKKAPYKSDGLCLISDNIALLLFI